jgi:hypothetical protein
MTQVSTVRRARKSQFASSDSRIFERSDFVLWSLAPSGIVLHNLLTRRFLELDELGYQAWAFLDGARTVDEVIDRCCASPAHSKNLARKQVRSIVNVLVEHRFVEERVDE